MPDQRSPAVPRSIPVLPSARSSPTPAGHCSAIPTSLETADAGSATAPDSAPPPDIQTAAPDGHTHSDRPPALAPPTPQNSVPPTCPSAAPACSQKIPPDHPAHRRSVPRSDSPPRYPSPLPIASAAPLLPPAEP